MNADPGPHAVPARPAPAAATADGRGGIPAASVAAVLAAGLVAYANSFGVPFVFDDRSNITQNAAVHALDLSPGSLAPAVQGFPAGRWLAHLTFAVNHALGGTSTAGYHAVNLAFHLAASLLVLLLAREVLLRAGGLAPARAVRAATVAALLFVAHPVHTQAVTYVVQRMTSMGGCFGLLALWLYVRGRLAVASAGAVRAGAVHFAGAAVAGYLAFACKENHAVLPALALLLEALLFPGLFARLRTHPRLLAAGAALATAGVALAAWRYGGFFTTDAPKYDLTTVERLLTHPRILFHYLSLLALPLPSRLHLDYAWAPSRGLLEPATTLPALLGLAALVGGAVAARRRAPLAAFAVAWFLVALAIEQSVIPLDLVFEHRLYLPSFGLLVLAGHGLERALGERRGGTWAAAAPLAGLLVIGTFARNETWRDPVALYADPAGHAPGDARNLITVGVQLMQAGRLDEAERSLREALALDPANPGPLVTLAAIHRERGNASLAVDTYRRALALNRGLPQAWDGLAWSLLDLKRVDEAEAAAREGLVRSPGFQPLRIVTSACRWERGDAAGARRELEEAVRADPGLWPAWVNLAQLLLLEGRADEAARAAGRYARAVPTDPAGHVVLGRALAAAGRAGEARAALDEALRLDPGNAEARAVREGLRQARAVREAPP